MFVFYPLDRFSVAVGEKKQSRKDQKRGNRKRQNTQPQNLRTPLPG
jgi:hypothetical protein